MQITKVDKMFVEKLKAAFLYFHIPYGKDCCNHSPVRFNKTTNTLEYYNGNGNWVNVQYVKAETDPIIQKTLQLKTVDGVDIVAYPVNVIAIDKTTILGQAANQTQYITLWNSSVINQPQGVLSAGTTPFEFKINSSATITDVLGSVVTP